VQPSLVRYWPMPFDGQQLVLNRRTAIFDVFVVVVCFVVVCSAVSAWSAVAVASRVR